MKKIFCKKGWIVTLLILFTVLSAWCDDFDELLDLVIWAPETQAETEIKESPKHSREIVFEEPVNLTGYKYLNIEMSGKNLGSDNLDIYGWNFYGENNEYNEEIFGLKTKLKSKTTLYQIPFGTYLGEWEHFTKSPEKGVIKELKANNENRLTVICFYIQNKKGQYTSNHKLTLYVKSITATNKKID